MNSRKLIQYLDDQEQAIEALIAQLDEVQVAFNAQFDEFKAQHDATLDRLTEQVATDTSVAGPQLMAAIEGRLPEERQRIDERRQKVREEYLPKRQQAADDLLNKAQAELAELRALNPQLDAQEEDLKAEKAGLEAQLAELNKEIGRLSRGLGVVRRFLAITKADQERQRVIGKLELINNSLRQVRQEWEQKREETEQHQADLQKEWQLESVAVARLQSELDQLDEEARREDLALRRAIRHVLDNLKEILSTSDASLDAGLQQMVQLNVSTDAYHGGLASVGGMIGLLRGIGSGNEAIRRSVEGLHNEQQMHSAYLKPLDFQLPSSVEAFHKQWPALAHQFADEKTFGAHPADFSSAVEPLLTGPLSESSIEAMFNSLGTMIQRATAHW
jgi:DNA repair exonuclease SbcCD ATPase subunit